ncbi:hypothetical protein D1007_57253 [Hordeum vulgare]|nr:hypothetical protein D1007_57253 [Hordeum vulgare]
MVLDHGIWPHDDQRKSDFLAELADIHNSMTGPWLIIGDFNLITDPRDKSNSRVCRRWMLKFRRTLNSSNLREIPLIGPKFTWSNEQAVPTLVRLDRAFCNVDWELIFTAAKLLPQSSAILDHCPLLLLNDKIVKTNRRFRFESYWQFVHGFKEVVERSWAAYAGNACPITTLNCKLWRLSKDLRSWSKNIVGDLQRQFHIITEIILQLDKAQDYRVLSQEESDMRSRLKARTLGLAVLLKIKLRQRSRILWLKAGDANTKFFQRKANARHNKNTIHALQGPVGMISSSDGMTELAHNHFTQIFGCLKHRSAALNWDALDLEHVDLTGLEHDLLMEEIKSAINAIPVDKAPGPDGFSGGFL